MATLKDRTLFITGASRGIGRAIALRAAADGANVVVAAKSDRPHRILPGTIHTAAADVEAAGGQALAVKLDVRDEKAIAEAVERTVERFGGIDILVNNAGAIQLTGTADTPMRRFDRLFDINVRGTFAATQACLPWLKRSTRAHVLNVAPPPTLDPGWWAPHVAYTMSKMGMSFCVLGMAEEFRADGIAVNALWPATVIATEALRMLPGDVTPERCRTPQIVADAAHAILTRDPRACTGRFLLDEEALREEGVTDFRSYAVSEGNPLLDDLYVGPPPGAGSPNAMPSPGPPRSPVAPVPPAAPSFRKDSA